jgi:hypothetical protein
MHGFLGADFWDEADPRKFSGRGAATPKIFCRFFLKKSLRWFPWCRPRRDASAQGAAGGVGLILSGSIDCEAQKRGTSGRFDMWALPL